MEKNSLENSDEPTKIKIKRSRRRLYQPEVNDNKTREIPGKVVETRREASKNEKPEKEKDRDIISNNREAKANEIIKKNMYWAAGIGLLPFPVFDLAALVTIQMKMIKDISKVYGIPFKKHLGKSFILSLLGGLNVFSLSWLTWYSFRKFIPGVGNLMGMASASAFGAATTYALGKVFIQHFEIGGTLLNFNPDEVRKYFQEQYEQGLKKAKKVKNLT